MKTARYLLKLFARWALLTLSLSLMLIGAAGRMGLPSLWKYLLTFSGSLLVMMLAIDPGLAEERSRTFGKGETPGRFAAGLSFLATLLLAALDVGRLNWFPCVPIEVRRSSLFLFAAAMALEMWAMVANPFFSPDIRLQPERGHRVITRGPYRLLRHPGYLAMLLSVPASGLAIGSWLALIPAAAFCLVILKRLGAEEKFLQNNLPGYTEYMDSVRGQLFPRVRFRRHPRQHPVPSEFASQDTDRRWR